MCTPVNFVKMKKGSKDDFQARLAGVGSLLMAAGPSLLCLVPTDWIGRYTIIAVLALVRTVGLSLMYVS